MLENFCEEALSSFAARCGEKLFLRSFFHDFSGIHEYDAVGHFSGKAHLMGNDHHGHTVLGQIDHDIEHFIDHFRVKRRSRFVKEHADRIHCKSAGDGHTLLLTAGKLRRKFIGMLDKTDTIQEIGSKSSIPLLFA